MKIQLIDRKLGMCNQWQAYFADCSDVIIHNGDLFSLPTDCIVSPANSFGFMDGGLDLVISMNLGWVVQQRLQKQIQEKYNGELLVGQAELVETGNDEIPFCISAPTMRVPLILENSPNVYLATRAIFLLLKNEPRINSISMSGLGTGVGKMPYNICAKQMRQAYDDIILGKYKFPQTWEESQKKHYELF
jgi:O-acetyl-ADP-ribose deacetylase (regulator of RNase III)